MTAIVFVFLFFLTYIHNVIFFLLSQIHALFRFSFKLECFLVNFLEARVELVKYVVGVMKTPLGLGRVGHNRLAVCWGLSGIPQRVDGACMEFLSGWVKFA